MWCFLASSKPRTAKWWPGAELQVRSRDQPSSKIRLKVRSTSAALAPDGIGDLASVAVGWTVLPIVALL